MEVKIKIHHGGKVEADVTGATGKTCDDAVKPLEELGPVATRTLKPSYWQREADKAKVKA